MTERDFEARGWLNPEEAERLRMEVDRADADASARRAESENLRTALENLRERAAKVGEEEFLGSKRNAYERETGVRIASAIRALPLEEGPSKTQARRIAEQLRTPSTQSENVSKGETMKAEPDEANREPYACDMCDRYELKIAKLQSAAEKALASLTAFRSEKEWNADRDPAIAALEKALGEK